MKNESIKTVVDGRRLSVQKTISGKQMMDFAIENGGDAPYKISVDETRSDMATSIARVISKIMPVSVVNNPGEDEVNIIMDVYIFSPEQLREYNKNIIEEYKQKSLQ